MLLWAAFEFLRYRSGFRTMSTLDLLQDPLVVRLLVTALLLLAVFGIRFLLVRRVVGDTHILEETQRRRLFYLRSAVTVTILLGLVLIWGGHLQNLLLSLTAVMVAVVIATKELLMCLSGFLLRTTGRLFSIGDWIECNGLRGEVTDQTLLSTTMLEVEGAAYGYGYTGRTLILPNSTFLIHPVLASTHARQYLQHRFVITLEQPVDPVAGLERLEREAEQAFAPYMEDARKANDALDRRLQVDVAGPEPHVTLGTTDLGKMHFAVLLFCPRQRAIELEREISGAFLRAVGQGEVPGAQPAGGQ